MKVLFPLLFLVLYTPSFAQNKAVAVAVYADQNNMLFTITPCCNEKVMLILIPGKVDLQSVKTLNHLYIESLRKYVSPFITEYIKGDNTIAKLYRNITLFTRNKYSNKEYTTEIFSFADVHKLKQKLRQKLSKLDAFSRIQKINQHFSEGMDAILVEITSDEIESNTYLKPLQFSFNFKQPLLPGIVFSSTEQSLHTELILISRETNFSLLHYKVHIPEMKMFENRSVDNIKDFHNSSINAEIKGGIRIFLEYLDPKEGMHNLFKSCRIDYKNDKLLLKSLATLGANWVTNVRDAAISKYTLLNLHPYNTKALRMVGNKYQNKFFIRYINLR